MKKTEWIPALLLSSAFAVSATYAVAQMGSGGQGMHKQQHMGKMGMGKMECPMMKEGARIDATATVEETPNGAIVRIAAKQAGDVQRVRELAQMVASHIQEGCPMHRDDEPAPAAAPAPAAVSKPKAK